MRYHSNRLFVVKDGKRTQFDFNMNKSKVPEQQAQLDALFKTCPAASHLW